MTKIVLKCFIAVFIATSFISENLNAQNNMNFKQILTTKQQRIIAIAALTAKGDLINLKPELNSGLESGLSINQIKELLVHLYAYCGFPRSIRGLQTFMDVLAERKSKGIIDVLGAEPSPILEQRSKYDRGREILEKLMGTPQEESKTGYSAFAPEIDVFLKEHLFADIFERDVLTYSERELVTISVISTIDRAEPMLCAHLKICLNVGLTPEQLKQFVTIIKSTIGRKEAREARNILDEVLEIRLKETK